MAQYSRPIRNTRHIESLQRLAQTTADLSFRNDVAEQRKRQEIERRARAMDARNRLGTVSQEPDLTKRNLMRSQIGFELQDLGVPVDYRMLGFEDAPKVVEPKPIKLTPKPTGAPPKIIGGMVHEEYTDWDESKPFDPKQLKPETPRYWKQKTQLYQGGVANPEKQIGGFTEVVDGETYPKPKLSRQQVGAAIERYTDNERQQSNIVRDIQKDLLVAEDDLQFSREQYESSKSEATPEGDPVLKADFDNAERTFTTLQEQYKNETGTLTDLQKLRKRFENYDTSIKELEQRRSGEKKDTPTKKKSWIESK